MRSQISSYKNRLKRVSPTLIILAAVLSVYSITDGNRNLRALTATDEEAGFEIPFEKRVDHPCPNSCSTYLSPLNKCRETTNRCSCAGEFFGADCSFITDKQCGVNVNDLQAAVHAHFDKNPGYDGLVQAHAHMILANQVLKNKVPGDVVELGVFKGGSSAVLVNVFETCSAKKFWLYDSYEGHPTIDITKNPGMEGWEGKHVGTLEDAKANVQALNPTLNIDDDRIIWKKGFFNETFLQPLPSTIAYLHIDCDWYECVVDSLDTFYDRVAWGGVIIFDDVGYYGFARAGLMEWVCRCNIVPALRSTFGVGQGYGGGSHFWIKGYQGFQHDQSPELQHEALWPGGMIPAVY